MANVLINGATQHVIWNLNVWESVHRDSQFTSRSYSCTLTWHSRNEMAFTESKVSEVFLAFLYLCVLLVIWRCYAKDEFIESRESSEQRRETDLWAVLRAEGGLSDGRQCKVQSEKGRGTSTKNSDQIPIQITDLRVHPKNKCACNSIDRWKILQRCGYTVGNMMQCISVEQEIL
ncbi:hypothetical protein F4703DRAFT_1917336 [Phycomyces blakesleeanus]